MAVQPFVDFGRFFSFLILYTVGRTPWTGDQPVARPLRTHGTTQTQNKPTQIYMPRVVFEPTIPALERALDRAVAVIGDCRYSYTILTLALDAGEWLASRHCRFTSGKGSPAPIG
jgi:hypothetical protein